MLGTVVLLLPQALRDLLGEEAYRDCVDAAQNHAMTLIVRSPDDVIYVDLPVFVIDGKSSTESSQPAVKPSANAKPAAKKAGRN